MDLAFLESFKNFLADRPEYALLTLSLTANVYLHRALLKAKDAHFATVERWLPIAEKMSSLLSIAANKARARKTLPPTRVDDLGE